MSIFLPLIIAYLFIKCEGCYILFMSWWPLSQERLSVSMQYGALEENHYVFFVTRSYPYSEKIWKQISYCLQQQKQKQKIHNLI